MERGCYAALNADQLWALVMSRTVMSHEEGMDQDERRAGRTDKGITQMHYAPHPAEVTAIAHMSRSPTSFKIENIYLFIYFSLYM